MGKDDDKQIANPAYEDLEKLKQDVSRDAPPIGDKLDDIAKSIGDGSVWYGTQADNFSADMTGKKQSLAGKTGALPGDVQEVLNVTPKKIPKPG